MGVSWLSGEADGILTRQRPPVGQNEAPCWAAAMVPSPQLPHHRCYGLRQKGLDKPTIMRAQRFIETIFGTSYMHRVVRSRATKGGQAAEESDGHRRVVKRNTQMTTG